MAAAVGATSGFFPTFWLGECSGSLMIWGPLIDIQLVGRLFLKIEEFILFGFFHYPFDLHVKEEGLRRMLEDSAV